MLPLRLIRVAPDARLFLTKASLLASLGLLPTGVTRYLRLHELRKTSSNQRVRTFLTSQNMASAIAHLLCKPINHTLFEGFVNISPLSIDKWYDKGYANNVSFSRREVNLKQHKGS